MTSRSASSRYATAPRCHRHLTNAQRVVGEQLQLPDEDVEQRLNQVPGVAHCPVSTSSCYRTLSTHASSHTTTQLAVLLPPLQHKLSVIKPALLARLCADPTAVAAALLRLKTIFPDANAATMALRCPALVVGDIPLDGVERSAAALRELLPNTRVDVLVEEHPDTMLDVEGLQDAMQRAHEVLPDVDVERMLAHDPSSVFSFQRGRRLIPYDADVPEDA